MHDSLSPLLWFLMWKKSSQVNFIGIFNKSQILLRGRYNLYSVQHPLSSDACSRWDSYETHVMIQQCCIRNQGVSCNYNITTFLWRDQSVQIRRIKCKDGKHCIYTILNYTLLYYQSQAAQHVTCAKMWYNNKWLLVIPTGFTYIVQYDCEKGIILYSIIKRY